MPNRLTNARIDFVSLVPRGADQDAHIVLAKAAPVTQTLKAVEPPAHKEATVPPDTITKARDGLEALASDVRKQHPALTPEQAYAEALMSEEGRALYGTAEGYEPVAAPVAKSEAVLKSDFEAELDLVRKADPSLSPELAYARALQTPAGRAAYGAGALS